MITCDVPARDMMNTECVVPAWLHDIFLGYGDPGEAHYSKMPEKYNIEYVWAWAGE